MTLKTRKEIPGRIDINNAFSDPKNLARLKDIYQDLVRHGGYHFGDLSAAFFNLTDNQRSIWKTEVNGNYNADVQHELGRVIHAALFHKDADGYDRPAPIKFNWITKPSSGLKFGIRTTYDPSGPSYLLEIIGFAAPRGESLFKGHTTRK
jgi:hypothetical protein